VFETLAWIFVGFALGAGLAALAARIITRRAMAKVRAAERRARSAERLAEVGSMTSGLAHEIKNPLSTIGLNAQLLAEGLTDLPDGKPVDADTKRRLTRRLDSLRREVDRLRGILTDFLTYAGELRLDPREADLNQVVEELADFFAPQAEQQGVRLRVQLEPGVLRAKLDVPLVKQAVLNLMLNAVQAMTPAPGAGGEAAPRELILKTASSSDDSGQGLIALHVIDTGPGIPADALPKIFQPYFTTKSGGTGLGLPTTRRIIEAHQGRLDLHTEVGRGTDFTVLVPALRPPA
jgi:signal transduction histidine kinase